LATTLELDDEQVRYLDDVLSIWIDGYEDAKESATTDPMIQQLDEFMQLSGGLVEQEAIARAIRERLRENAHA
jgi:hypothetical protein